MDLISELLAQAAQLEARKDYQDKFYTPSVCMTAISSVLASLVPVGRVLDLGAGDGRLGKLFPELCEVDFVESDVERQKEVSEADLTKFMWKDYLDSTFLHSMQNLYDCVISNPHFDRSIASSVAASVTLKMNSFFVVLVPSKTFAITNTQRMHFMDRLGFSFLQCLNVGYVSFLPDQDRLPMAVSWYIFRKDRPVGVTSSSSFIVPSESAAKNFEVVSTPSACSSQAFDSNLGVICFRDSTDFASLKSNMSTWRHIDTSRSQFTIASKLCFCEMYLVMHSCIVFSSKFSENDLRWICVQFFSSICVLTDELKAIWNEEFVEAFPEFTLKLESFKLASSTSIRRLKVESSFLVDFALLKGLKYIRSLLADNEKLSSFRDLEALGEFMTQEGLLLSNPWKPASQSSKSKGCKNKRKSISIPITSPDLSTESVERLGEMFSSGDFRGMYTFLAKKLKK